MEYLTISEYAREMKVSRQAIQNRIRNGTLATVIKNKKVKLIPYESQDDTVASRKSKEYT